MPRTHPTKVRAIRLEPGCICVHSICTLVLVKQVNWCMQKVRVIRLEPGSICVHLVLDAGVCGGGEATAGPQFACFTSTKVQIMSRQKASRCRELAGTAGLRPTVVVQQ
jgi:hypothetical protein